MTYSIDGADFNPHTTAEPTTAKQRAQRGPYVKRQHAVLADMAGRRRARIDARLYAIGRNAEMEFRGDRG